MLYVKPTFNRKDNMMTLPAATLNLFAQDEIQDNTGFYQQQFGVFGYMRLTNKLKFILHNLRGIPFLWQPHKTCGWDPLGAMYTGRREITPCEAKLNAEYCIDEMFDGCFSHLLRWDGRGPLTLDANGEALINKMVKVLTTNAILGAHLTLTLGQLYDPNTVVFNEKTPLDIRNMFKKTIGTCKGWLELLKEAAQSSADLSHLNIPDLLPNSAFSGKTYIGDPIALYDNTFGLAPVPLQTAVNEGGMVQMEGGGQVVWIVSTSIYNKVAADYRALCQTTDCLNPRLSQRNFKYGGRDIHVYYIDDTAIVPSSVVSQVDQYLTGAMHFSYLTVAGNITLGSAFSTIDGLDVNGNSNAGIAIQKATDLRELGMYFFTANNLFQTTVNDTDYIAGAQAYKVPVA